MSAPRPWYPVVVRDIEPAAWLVDDLAFAEYSVASLVPRGYEAYARILHPADSPGGEPVRWDAVARWSGRELDTEARFAALSRPTSGVPTEPPPFDEPPRTGSLPETELVALCAVLADYTGTPEDCWFCLWDGWGWLEPASNGAILRAEAPGSESAAPSAHVHPPVGYLADAVSAPRVRLPTRDYVLLNGPVKAATMLGDAGEGYFFPQSPNIFWPADRAWCVATEIDLDSTYVAGSADLIQVLLANETLEVLEVTPADGISAAGD